MKVYLVNFYQDNGEHDTEKAFATLEKAEAYLATKTEYQNHYTIEEFDIE